MQKKVEITVPSGRTDELIDRIRDLDGLIGLRVSRDTSLQPSGDVISAVLSNRALHALMRVLDDRRIGHDPDSSATTTQVASVMSPQVAEGIGSETSDLTWEEIELEMAKESNMTANALLLMMIGGAIAAVGIVNSTLHLVIGAMIVSPGFEPITRISLGVVTRTNAWRRGLLDVAKGYTALVIGAVVATLALYLLGKSPPVEEGSYLASGALVSYWTTITGAGLFVSVLAGAAGAILLKSDRSVLTVGVLIALALVPSATLVGVGVVTAEMELVGRALLRWALDVALVAAGALPVFVWHARRVGRRSGIL